VRVEQGDRDHGHGAQPVDVRSMTEAHCGPPLLERPPLLGAATAQAGTRASSTIRTDD
jgi:hypothetical protein